VQVGSRFQVFRPYSFSTIPRVSIPILFFCAPGLIFCGTEGVGSRFHYLRPGTHFQRYRGRGLPFSSFARSDSFSTVPRASAPVLRFWVLKLVFGGNECVGSRFHVLRSLIRFRLYQRRRLSFSCFALPDTFSAVPRASAPVFMYCVPGHIFGGTEGVGSRFYVSRSQTRFRRYQGRRSPL
jgi:hypothetical protein